MADPKRLAEDATTKAVLAAGRDAAKRAASELLSPEEGAGTDAERADAGKKRRNKLLLVGVLALFVVIGVIGMLISYWHWFLALGALGLGGLYGRWRYRRYRAARLEAAAATRKSPPLEAEPRATALGEQVRRAPAAAPLPDARALAEARAAEEEAVDDELAALKARMKR